MISHKTTDMVNVVNWQCEKAGCMTIPSFNLLEEKSAHFCKAHRNPGMVNIIGPKYKGMIAQSLCLCIISDCKKPSTHELSNPTRISSLMILN
ncbi:hypothetical protein MNEG_12039 [Rhizophagus irregularis DAOM 181602=DAOM 197198]|nr:hypothetical protein MNEG_12039 [Rhizophagus irregularis DAOM 181602=DAOM 197198]